MQAITELTNPRTGEAFTPTEAQRILRADFKRRVRATRYITDYKKRRANNE